MAQNIVAIVIGMVLGMALNMGLIQMNFLWLFPMPAGLDMNAPEAFNTFLGTLPAQGFCLVLVAHLAQSFVGGWCAARLSASHPMRSALAVGVLSLGAGVMAMTMIEGPDWLIVELPGYLLVAWAAGHIEEKRRTPEAPNP